MVLKMCSGAPQRDPETHDRRKATRDGGYEDPKLLDSYSTPLPLSSDFHIKRLCKILLKGIVTTCTL